MKLVETWKKCSVCIDFCIGLGERLFDTGIAEMEQLVEILKCNANLSISPRVLPSYATLLWFAQEVHGFSP